MIEFATEVRISLIGNPHDCVTETLDVMIKNYFLHPRFLHVNDIFRIDAREHAQDLFYSSGSPGISARYFTVRALKVNRNGCSSNVNSCYVVLGESMLIQETQVLYDYIPRERIHSLPDNAFFRRNKTALRSLNHKYPSALMEPLEHLESCIMPFLRKGKLLRTLDNVRIAIIAADILLIFYFVVYLADVRLNIRPVFLVKGPRGCGKHELVRAASKRLGLNFLDHDFVEVQTLTSAQTEVKLCAMLANAQNCVPCILYLNNVQVR